MSLVTCLTCHYATELRRLLEPCPNCGSNSGVLNSIDLPGVEIFPSVELKAKNPSYKGRHKYVRDTKSIAEYSENGHLVRVDQSIDRGNDSYRKTVTAVDTGEVIRKADHPLSEHTGRGSDRPGRK